MRGSTGGLIGRLTPTGHFTFFSGPGHPGPDHNLWITSIGGPGNLSSLARLTPAGQFTYFTVPNKDEAWDLANGPGGLWFTLIRDQAGNGGAIDQFTLPAR